MLFRSTDSKLIAMKKKEMINLCARWIADSMRTFSIVNDRGFRVIVGKCIDSGKFCDGSHHQTVISL